MRALQFPEAHPGLRFSQRGDAVMVMTSTNEALELTSVHLEILRRLDGNTELEEVARAVSEGADEEISTQDLAEFLDAARKLGLLSLRCAGPADEGVARRRCPKTARLLRSIGLPPKTGDPTVDGLSRALMNRLKAQDPRGAVGAAYALNEVAGDAAWMKRLLKEVERLGDAPAMGEFNPAQILIPIANPERLLKWLDSKLGWTFGWVGLSLWTALCGLGLLAASQLELPSLAAAASPEVLFFVYLAHAIHTPIHEFSHALTCKHYGQPVNRMGVGFLFAVIPIFWADVTPSYLLKEKWKRVLVLVAGSMGSIFTMAMMAILCFLLLPPDSAARQGLTVFVLVAAGVQQFVFNLSPFFRLDGYYILSELVDVPNLMTRSEEWIRAVIARFFAGDCVELPEATRWEKWVLTLYSVCGTGYILSCLFLSVSWLYHQLVGKWRGYGLALLVVGVSIFVGGGILKDVVAAARFAVANRRHILALDNLKRTAPVLGGLALLLVLVRLPESAEATFVLEPARKVEVRASVEGQLTSLAVRSGQQVVKGQPLAQLENLALERRRLKLVAELEVAQAQAARVSAGARAEERRAARAAVRGAEALAAETQRSSSRQQALLRAGLASRNSADDARAQAGEAALAAGAAETERTMVEAGGRQEDIDAAQARVKRAEAALANVTQQLASLTVNSPADGVVSDSFIEEELGKLFKQGDRILTVQSQDEFSAELVVPWLADPEAAVTGTAKLLLPTGRPVVASISAAKIMRVGANQPFVLETATLRGADLKAGLQGRARVYGQRVPLFVEYLWHPVKRFFVAELWGSL
jgi:multidrug efflux pump subunit AcrA (membrane-fusion protein)